MKIVLVYIYVNQGGIHDEYALRFAQSYDEFPAGVEHDTIISVNGGRISKKLRGLFECVGSLPNVNYFPRGNDGWDIGGFQDVAASVKCDAILCLGESVYFHRKNWMVPLIDAWNKYGPGMYGPFSSNDKRPHLNTTAFMCKPSMLTNYRKVISHDDRYMFEHGTQSCCNVAIASGVPVMTVNWSGCYRPDEWREPPNILRRGDQSNCLMWCNHTDAYENANPAQKRDLESVTDGKRKIAVFYHARLFGGNPPVSTEHSVSVMRSQMKALRVSGLLDAAEQVHIGVNGDQHSVDEIAPQLNSRQNITWLVHGEASNSERKTLITLHEFAKSHHGWLICYFHLKGACHPKDAMVESWRKCMEKHVIYNWKRCVADLNAGYDSAGAHWLTKEKYGGWMKTPFWGGNFWWAKASFLSTLEPLMPDVELPDLETAKRIGGYDVETWIGKTRIPRVMDYANHWPGDICSNELR